MFSLTEPVMQRLWCTADLGGNGTDGGPLRGVIGFMIEDHADGPLTDHMGISLGSVHGSTLSRFEASGNPGTVHCMHVNSHSLSRAQGLACGLPMHNDYLEHDLPNRRTLKHFKAERLYPASKATSRADLLDVLGRFLEHFPSYMPYGAHRVKPLRTYPGAITDTSAAKKTERVLH